MAAPPPAPGPRSPVPGLPGETAAWSWGSSTSRPTPFPTVATGSAPTPRSRTDWTSPPRAPTSSTWAGSRPGPARSVSPAEEEVRRVSAGHRRTGPGGCAGQRGHDARPRGRAGPGGRGAPGQRRQRRPRRPAYAPAGGQGVSALRGHALARPQPRHELPRRSTAMWCQEVRDELRRRVDAVVAEGVDPSLIILDPGLGFSKLSEHNWRLLAALPEIACLGSGAGAGGPHRFPVLVGASRKRFLGRLLRRRPTARRARSRQRRRDGGHDRARRRVGRLVRAGPPGPAQRRCRPGRGRLARRRAGPPMENDNTDQIELRGLRVRGRHGVLAFERRDGQDFLVDAVLAWTPVRPPRTDDLTLTVDYGGLSERLAAIVARRAGPAHRDAGPAAGLGLPGRARGPASADHRAQAARADQPPVRRRRRSPSTRAARSQAVLALGSNLGDRLQELQQAVDQLAATPGLGSPRSRRSTRPTPWAARNSPTT